MRPGGANAATHTFPVTTKAASFKPSPLQKLRTPRAPYDNWHALLCRKLLLKIGDMFLHVSVPETAWLPETQRAVSSVASCWRVGQLLLRAVGLCVCVMTQLRTFNAIPLSGSGKRVSLVDLGQQAPEEFSCLGSRRRAAPYDNWRARHAPQTWPGNWEEVW